MKLSAASAMATAQRCTAPSLPVRRIGALPSIQQACRRSVSSHAYQPGSGGREQQPVDWDSAWRSFQNDVRSQVDSNVTTQTTFRPVALPRNGDVQQQIRRQEAALLNVWSSQAFQSAGTVAAIVLFVSMIVVAGPPPSDGRCTLPWC